MNIVFIVNSFTPSRELVRKITYSSLRWDTPQYVNPKATPGSKIVASSMLLDLIVITDSVVHLMWLKVRRSLNLNYVTQNTPVVRVVRIRLLERRCERE